MQDRESIQSTPRALKIWAGMIAIYVIWGSTYLAIRFAVETLPPFLMAAVRFLVAGILLYAFRRIMRDPLPTKNESRSAAFVGILLLTVGNGCVVWAEQYIQSGLAALLIGTTPLWMILLQILLPFGRKPNIQGIVAVLIGFIGLVILFWPELRPGGGQGNFLAYLVVILGTVSWAFGSLYSRSANLPKSPLMGTALEMLAGGAGLVILGGISGEFGNIHPEYFSLRSLLSLSYLIIFGSLVGFVAYTWLLRSAPISLVSTYAYVNPVVALLLGSFLANEVLTGRTILAAVIILFAVIFLSVTNSRKSSLRAISDG